MDDHTAYRIELLKIAHRFATDEGELISIADSLWEWASGGEVVISFEPEGK